MYKIIHSDTQPHYLKELREQFLKEWKEINPFEGIKHGFNIPSPLIVVSEKPLLGGLSFTWYPLSGTNKIKLWINGIRVLPEYRGQGIASRLIREAEREARRMNVKELYAFTHIPELYQKLGWKVNHHDEKNYALFKTFES